MFSFEWLNRMVGPCGRVFARYVVILTSYIWRHSFVPSPSPKSGARPWRCWCCSTALECKAAQTPKRSPAKCEPFSGLGRVSSLVTRPSNLGEAEHISAIKQSSNQAWFVAGHAGVFCLDGSSKWWSNSAFLLPQLDISTELVWQGVSLRSEPIWKISLKIRPFIPFEFSWQHSPVCLSVCLSVCLYHPSFGSDKWTFLLHSDQEVLAFLVDKYFMTSQQYSICKYLQFI